MTDHPGELLQEPRFLLPARPPGVLYAAAVVTWVAATGTAVLVFFLTVFLVWFAGSLLEVFDGDPPNHAGSWWAPASR